MQYKHPDLFQNSKVKSISPKLISLVLYPTTIRRTNRSLETDTDPKTAPLTNVPERTRKLHSLLAFLTITTVSFIRNDVDEVRRLDLTRKHVKPVPGFRITRIASNWIQPSPSETCCRRPTTFSESRVMPRPITPSEGQQIVSFVQRSMGSPIDRGECWDVAERGILSISARRPQQSSLYVWGSVITVSQLQPGDILQFSNFVMRVTQPDTSWVEQSLGSPRHTAVVQTVFGGGKVTILHQNYDPPGRVVSSLANIYLAAGTHSSGAVITVQGSVTCYRPMIP